ncbi:MAG: calcium-binding protein [Synechococcales bacterium]|nr:calcium-binding protein [Synechococcales bacterium]
MPTRTKKDEAREERIVMEAIVDAYGAEEQAMGWYYYLDDRITFPFEAQCIAERRTSMLQLNDKITVLSMADEDECLHEMQVLIHYQKRDLVIPLAQIEGIDVDEDTEEAIGDWHYWVAQGYEFG